MRYSLIPVIAAVLTLSALQSASAQGKPETTSATGKIAEITVTGNTKFPVDQIIAASQLSPGEVVAVDQLQAAANRLAALGVFNAVNYRYWSKGDSINVEFQVQPAPAVPLAFDNFPWFSDQEIAAAIRQQVGLFDGEAPEGGTLLNQITAALEKLLSSRQLGGIVVHQLIAKPVGAIVHLFDPVAYVSGILLIIIACGAAAWFPTMNAARIDPMKSLRHD